MRHVSANFVRRALGQSRYVALCWFARTPDNGRRLVLSPATDGIHGALAPMASMLSSQRPMSACSPVVCTTEMPDGPTPLICYPRTIVAVTFSPEGRQTSNV